MNKLICDLCGKEIESKADYAGMIIHSNSIQFTRDFHVACSVRLDNVINSFLSEAKAKSSFEARWEYWPGWGGNHDKRIEDAKCSRCGYQHPTVRGTPKLLADVCPRCKSKMDKGDNDD